MKPELLDAIKSLNSNAEFTIGSNSIDEITWVNNTPEIAKKDIEKELKRLQDEYDANQYQRDRQYPQLGEQLDMLFHDMTAGKGTKDGEWYKAIAKVKTDNPKPTE